MSGLRVEWRAGEDGLAHCLRRGKRVTLCGQAAVDEQRTYTIRERHDVCREALAHLKNADLRARFGAVVARGGR